MIMSSNNTFAMRSGWKEFVIANRIDKNDVLVFTYNGNSSFKVAIFDRSGCEKAAPFFAKKMEMEIETQSEESNDSSIRENVALHSEVKKEIISFSSGSSDSDESLCDISSRAIRARTIRERVCCKRKQREFVQESSEGDKGEHGTVRIRKTKENRTMKASHLYILPIRTRLTKAQEEIANRMARKTQKGSDLLVKILTPSEIPPRVNCVLRLPVGFARKILESEEKKIILLPADLDKRSKTCTAKYMKNKNCKYIGQGWNKFVCINGLKEGDLCLFELRKQERGEILTMVVHFNRVSS
ncbi:B3 domain-containing protein Os03g0622100-like isoform X1 [Carex rostrata]